MMGHEILLRAGIRCPPFPSDPARSQAVYDLAESAWRERLELSLDGGVYGNDSQVSAASCHEVGDLLRAAFPELQCAPG